MRKQISLLHKNFSAYLYEIHSMRSNKWNFEILTADLKMMVDDITICAGDVTEGII